MLSRYTLLGRKLRLRFSSLLERHYQNSLTALVINLNHEVILLVGGQIIPVRNDLHKNLCHSQCGPTGSVNIGQIIAFGILDPIVLTAHEKTVLGHG